MVGSQARILYADSEGTHPHRAGLQRGHQARWIGAPIVLGRDHRRERHRQSVSRDGQHPRRQPLHRRHGRTELRGRCFPWRPWIDLHNGGGVGWGEDNGGFGMVLDGGADSDRRLKSMLLWDVNNGIARRAWARNPTRCGASSRR